jgi:uncharacterized protein (TIGR03086 family)
METIDAFHRVTTVAQAVIGSLSEDQFTLPTPCTEWTVRDVLNHIRHGDALVTAWLTGTPAPDSGDTDYLGEHPTNAVFQGMAETTAALAVPGILERTIPTRMGDMRVGAPGSDGLIERRIADLFVHLWDLAAATGQSTDLDPELAEVVQAHFRSRLEGVDRSDLAGARPQPVAEARPAPEHATAADRLAAYLGREVTTSTAGR